MNIIVTFKLLILTSLLKSKLFNFLKHNQSWKFLSNVCFEVLWINSRERNCMSLSDRSNFHGLHTCDLFISRFLLSLHEFLNLIKPILLLRLGKGMLELRIYNDAMDWKMCLFWKCRAFSLAYSAKSKHFFQSIESFLHCFSSNWFGKLRVGSGTRWK